VFSDVVYETVSMDQKVVMESRWRKAMKYLKGLRILKKRNIAGQNDRIKKKG
jgi:hypothetical protein